MQHALRYHGGFERNFAGLKAGASSFRSSEGDEGSEHKLEPWPENIDGIRVSFMEKAGKKFFVVRIEDGKSDIVLQNEVILTPSRHLGYNKRFSPELTMVEDAAALSILEDAMMKNPAQGGELGNMRARIKSTIPPKEKRTKA